MKKSDAANVAKKAQDGWNNIVSGLNIKGKDKKVSTQMSYVGCGQIEAEQIFSGDDQAEKIVSTLPEDMMREGTTFTGEDTQETFNLDMKNYADKLGFFDKYLEGLIWARLYGGAGIVMGINDGGREDDPVNVNKIRSIDWLATFHRYELEPNGIQADVRKPGFRLPEFYKLTGTTQSIADAGENEFAGSKIHASRILRIDGMMLPTTQFIANNYWGDTIFSRLKDDLQNWNMSYDSVATIISEYTIPIFKMKNLGQLLAEGRDDLVQKRLDLVNAVKSVVRAVILQDDESFSRETPNLGPLPQLLDKMDNRLASSSKMPATILFGAGPKGGLGAAGESEEKDWNKHVGRQQEKQMNPNYDKFFGYALASSDGPTNGTVPKSWSYTHNPLDEQGQTEILKDREVQAKIDDIYMKNGVLDPEEVTASRFGTGEYSYETTIDDKNREDPKIETKEFEND